MSLHRQPHEEQEEIFTSILSSFSSLAATSPSFSSCFPEHSEINSYFPALLLLKVRRGTWLRKGCTEPPADLHFGIRWFFVKINGQWIVEMFSQCDYVTPLSNRLFRAVERYFSSKSSPFVNFIFLHPLIWWIIGRQKKTEKYQFFHSSNSGFSVFSFSQSFGKLLALFSSAFRFDRLWG